MKNKIAIALTTIVALLFLAATSSWVQKKELKKFVQSVPKGTYFVDVVIEASKIPFTKVSLGKTSFWSEKNEWLPPSIDIELSTVFGNMYCNIDYFADKTTGEWGCVSSYDISP